MIPAELFDDAVRPPHPIEGEGAASGQPPAPESPEDPAAPEVAAEDPGTPSEPELDVAPEAEPPKAHIADKLNPKKVIGELYRLITYAQNAPLTKTENVKEIQPGESEARWVRKETPTEDAQRDRGLRALKVLDRKQLSVVCSEVSERETYRALVDILAEAWAGGIPPHLFA